MAVKFYLDKRLSKQGEAPIRCSVMIQGQRLLTTTGYNINPGCWDNDAQKVLLTAAGKPVVNARGVKAKVINAYLKRIDSYFSDLENNLLNTGNSVGDIKTIFKTKFGRGGLGNKHNEPQGFYDYFDEFTEEMGKQNNWTPSTHEKFHALKNHIRDYSENVSFDSFDEKGLTNFVEFMRYNLDLKNSTIGKQLGFLKWFLKWATGKGYNQEMAFRSFSPKLKATEKKIVFLDWEELMKVYTYNFPEAGETIILKDLGGREYEKHVRLAKTTLEHVRDVFCFCCFTSLRYSDVANLKRSNVFPDYIQITTIKTADTLKIELNKYSAAILEKYKDSTFPHNKVLPVMSNQRMNEYLKEMAEIIGFNEPVTVTYYKGNQRIDEVYPKWSQIGTHTGRRTFICNALMLGIAPQIVMKWTGHSDYKAMKPYIDIADKAKADAMKLFDK
jgi:integrase